MEWSGFMKTWVKVWIRLSWERLIVDGVKNWLGGGLDKIRSKYCFLYPTDCRFVLHDHCFILVRIIFPQSLPIYSLILHEDFPPKLLDFPQINFLVFWCLIRIFILFYLLNNLEDSLGFWRGHGWHVAYFIAFGR